MDLVIVIAALVGALWTLVFWVRGGLLAGVLAAVFGAIVLGYPVFRQPLGFIELTLDRALCFLMVGQYALWRLLHREVRRPAAVDYVLLALVGWLTISTILFPPLTGPAIGKLLCYYLIPTAVYFVARQSVTGERGATAILIFFAALGAYLALTAVAENREAWSFVFPTYIGTAKFPEFLGRARGPLLNPAGNGLLIVTSCAAAFALWGMVNRAWRPLLVALVGLMLGGTFLTLTRSVWMGAALSIGLTAALYLPRRATIGLAAIGFAALLPLVFANWDDVLSLKRDRGMDAAASADSVRLRPILAYIAYEMFLDHPVAGCGLGGYSDAAVDYVHDRSIDLPLQKGLSYVQHNVILGLLTETGLLGAGLFVALLVLWSKSAWRLWSSSEVPPQQRQLGFLFLVLLVNYLVNGMFQDVAIIQAVNVVLFFVAGAMQGVATSHQKVAPAKPRLLAAANGTEWTPAAV
jgi:O-antigen ligase